MDLVRSGFKTSDEAQWPRLPAGFHVYFYQNYGVQQAQADRESAAYVQYVSIYRRPATQPLGLRWGFETTSSVRSALVGMLAGLFFGDFGLTFGDVFQRFLMISDIRVIRDN